MRRRYRRAFGGLEERERGSVTAELLIATPVLFLLVLSVVQFALFEDASHIAEAAAEQGLVAGRVADGSSNAGNAAASSLLGQIGNAVLSDASISSERGAATTSVTVTGHAEAVLPFLSLPVRVVVSAPTEQFVADGAASGGANP